MISVLMDVSRRDLVRSVALFPVAVFDVFMSIPFK